MKLSLSKMTPNEKRSKFENDAHHYVIDLYNKIADNYNVTITDWDIPEDPYSRYDMSCTINSKPVYIENKSRQTKYHYTDFIKTGYRLKAHKLNNATIFNYLWVQDNICMITNKKQIEDLEPIKTYSKHLTTVNDESSDGYELNYVIPYERFWVFRLSDGKLISKPKKR